MLKSLITKPGDELFTDRISMTDPSEAWTKQLHRPVSIIENILLRPISILAKSDY